MSGVIVLVPVVVASWPAIAAAITVASANMGFKILKEELQEKESFKHSKGKQSVPIEMDNMDVVEESIKDDKKIVVVKQGVRVEFSKNARGQFKTTVFGDLPKVEMKKIGEEIAGRVIQQYTYSRLTEALEQKGFITMEDEVTEDDTIRLQVRRHNN